MCPNGHDHSNVSIFHYRKSPISAVPWGKDKSALIEYALIEYSNKNHEIRGKRAKKSTFLDNYACFQNRTIAKSALIETALSGDSLYKNFGLLINSKTKNLTTVHLQCKSTEIQIQGVPA